MTAAEYETSSDPDTALDDQEHGENNSEALYPGT